LRVAFGFVVLAVILAVVAATTVVSPGRLSLEALALTSFGLAGFCAYVFEVPRFVRNGKAVEDQITWVKMVITIFGFALVCFFVMWGAKDVHEAWESANGGPKPHSNSSHVIVFLCTLYLLTLLTVMLRSTRNVAMVVRVLAASTRGIAGRVEDPTPVEVGGEDRAVAQIVEKTNRGSDPEIITEHTLNVGTFVVVTGDGQRVEVNPEASTWASSIRKKPGDDLPQQKRFADVVAIGGNVWIVDDELGGRLFYATPAGTSARSRLRLVAAMRLGVALLLLACIAGMVARTAQLAPRLPDFDVDTPSSI
jgi:hypothetical protein